MNENYADLVAWSQFLPGPASSQGYFRVRPVHRLRPRTATGHSRVGRYLHHVLHQEAAVDQPIDVVAERLVKVAEASCLALEFYRGRQWAQIGVNAAQL